MSRYTIDNKANNHQRKKAKQKQRREYEKCRLLTVTEKECERVHVVVTVWSERVQ
jgi:hypothetical protein